MKTILFRLDVSKHTGYGHFFRCVSLATILKKKFKIIFVFNDLNRDLKKFMKTKKFKFFLIKTYNDNKNFEKTHSDKIQIEDAKKTLKIINKTNSTIVLLDDYKKDFKWEKFVKASNCKIIVLDDLANRKHFCEILCDSNILSNYINRYKNKVLKNTKLLLGSKFIILRDNFKVNRKKKKIKKNVKKIHFCLNNSVNLKFIRIVLEALNYLYEKNKDINLEIFLLNKNIKILKLIKSIRINFSMKIFINKKDISKNIKNSDLGFGFAGTSMYERAYLGLPTLTFSSSKNQALSLYDKMSNKFILPVKNKNLNKYDIFLILNNFIKNYDLRLKLSEFGQKEIDGNGANRIVKEIIRL